jgi:hypothetical protein
MVSDVSLTLTGRNPVKRVMTSYPLMFRALIDSGARGESKEPTTVCATAQARRNLTDHHP